MENCTFNIHLTNLFYPCLFSDKYYMMETTININSDEESITSLINQTLLLKHIEEVRNLYTS